MYTGYWSLREGVVVFKQILLAVDGSEHALKAAKLAGDLARAVNAAHLRVVIWRHHQDVLWSPDKNQKTSSRHSTGDRRPGNARTRITSGFFCGSPR